MLVNRLGEQAKQRFFQHNARIFQALLVMLEDKSLFTQLTNEAEKLSKRSREFEARLNRSVFETKQQVNLFF